MGHIEQRETIARINQETFGPATSFSDLPRDEKQKAYELAVDGHGYGRSFKLEKRLVRGRKKWANRYSQIKYAAKLRGRPWQWRKWVDMWGWIGRTHAAASTPYGQWVVKEYGIKNLYVGAA